jgi:hypothetical protein
VEGILSKYFETLGPDEPLFSRGAIAWAPSAFLLEEFQEIQFSNPNPAVDFGKGYITLKNRTATDCHSPQSGVFSHLPIHAIQLRANEVWGALKFKMRKVVIVSVGTELTGLGDRALKKVSARYPDCFLCAPIYTLKSDNEPAKYPASFIEMVKAYSFPMAFHFRAEGGMRESCVRFDRIQAIAKPFLKPDKTRLSDECLKVFDGWLYNFMFGVLPANSEIPEYRALLREGGGLSDGAGAAPKAKF